MDKKRKEVLRQAKYYAKKWHDNGWKDSRVLCVDKTWQDNDYREIAIKDANNLNGFDFLWNDCTFAVVTYNGQKMEVNLAQSSD